MTRVEEFKKYVTDEGITGISGFQLGDKGSFCGTWDDFLEGQAEYFGKTVEATANMYLGMMLAPKVKVVGECDDCHGMLVENEEHSCEETRKEQAHYDKLLHKGTSYIDEMGAFNNPEDACK